MDRPINTPRTPIHQQHISDIRGLVQLTREATLDATRVVEGVHQSVWSGLAMPGGRRAGSTRGITGLVYRSINGVTRLVGAGADAALAGIQPLFTEKDPETPESPKREAFIAALNGVMGDRLQADQNPFATAMTLRHRGAVLDETLSGTLPSASGKVLLLIHGLCMNDLQWRRKVEGQIVDHGQILADQLGYTPVYLRYNTGLPIARNAALLAAEMENLSAIWPVPIESLSMVAHSMGGLLARHAVHQARNGDMQWLKRLNKVVFLGTPHHGAPLEKAGAWVQTLLGATPYSAPFAKLSGLRSAGITDLRHGLTAEELPLTPGINWYSVAATTAARRGVLANHLTGDGLVPLRSALGECSRANESLLFANGHTRVVHGTSHLGLLSSSRVSEQLLKWLGQV
ncbi:MAG TPA: hypothetical protein VJ984_10560 [Xanthomonadales bacterium]|nr:hypothetical protein [Xanthomonadales bacterium]